MNQNKKRELKKSSMKATPKKGNPNDKNVRHKKGEVGGDPPGDYPREPLRDDDYLHTNAEEGDGKDVDEADLEQMEDEQPQPSHP